jgi:DNA excision repair protein ERCC-1
LNTSLPISSRSESTTYVIPLHGHIHPSDFSELLIQDYNSILRSALTSVKSVNKTDVTTLKSQFGSFSNIVHATPAQLLDCPGFGNLKVRRLKDAVDKPFHPRGTKTQAKLTGPSTSTSTVSKPTLPTPSATRPQLMQTEPRGQPAGPSPASLSPTAPVEFTGRVSANLGQAFGATQAPKPPQIPEVSQVPRAPARAREPSPEWPEWDIDLDLNNSDEG